MCIKNFSEGSWRQRLEGQAGNVTWIMHNDILAIFERKMRKVTKSCAELLSASQRACNATVSYDWRFPVFTACISNYMPYMVSALYLDGEQQKVQTFVRVSFFALCNHCHDSSLWFLTGFVGWSDKGLFIDIWQMYQSLCCALKKLEWVPCKFYLLTIILFAF